MSAKLMEHFHQTIINFPVEKKYMSWPESFEQGPVTRAENVGSKTNYYANTENCLESWTTEYLVDKNDIFATHKRLI